MTKLIQSCLSNPIRAGSKPASLALALVLGGAVHADFNPILLVPGSFNADIVVEQTAPPPLVPGAYTTATMDGGKANTGTTWYEAGFMTNAAYVATGLPAAGSAITNASLPDHAYQLAPSYLVNNAMMLDAANFTNGTFVITSPANFGALSFLTSGANGGCQFVCTIHHQDGSSETLSVTSPDWLSATNPAFTAHGRVNAQGFGASGLNGANPRLGSSDVPLANTSSPVTAIDVQWSSGNTNAHSCIMALSGQSPAGGSFNPIIVTGYNADIVVEASAGPYLSAADRGFVTMTMQGGTNLSGNTWYEQGYDPMHPATGLPPAGSFISSTNMPDHIYLMPSSYADYNAACTDSNHPIASLTFASPDYYSALSLLGAAGNGPLAVQIVVHHADGSVETNTWVALDWLNGVPAAWTASGGVSVNSRVLSYVNSGNPRMYEAQVPVSNLASPVTGLDLVWTRDNGMGGFPSAVSRAAVLAVSGQSPFPPAVGVNFVDPSDSFEEMLNPGDLAGALPTTNWLNALDSFGTMDLGNGMSVSWSADQNQNLSWTNVGPDFGLMKGYLESTGTNTTTVSVTGIPYQLYDVYVYSAPDSQQPDNTNVFRVTEFNLNGSISKFVGHDSTLPDFDGTYVESEDTSGGPETSVGNYVVFEGVTGSNFTLIASGNYGAPIFIDPQQPAPQNKAAFNGLVVKKEDLVPFVWNQDNNSNWQVDGNWDRAKWPENAGSWAKFENKITQPRTVTLSNNVIVTRMNLDNVNPYTITGKEIAYEAYEGFDTLINVYKGSHTISAPLALQTDSLSVNLGKAGEVLSLSGAISGRGGLAIRSVNRGGMLVLGATDNNANTYQGENNIYQGAIVKVVGDKALGASTHKTFVKGGIVYGPGRQGPGSTLGFGGGLNGKVQYSDRQAVELQGLGNGLGAQLGNAPALGMIHNFDGNNSFAGDIELKGNSSVSADSGVLTLSGAISGLNTASLTKLGPGRVVLSGANTYQGNTTIKAGILGIGANGALGAAGNVAFVTNGATIDFERVNYTTAVDVKINGDGVREQLNVPVGALTTADTGAAFTARFFRSIQLMSDSSIGAAARTLFTLSGDVYAGGRNPPMLTKVGGGVLELDSAKTINGKILINNGTLRVSADGALGAGDGTDATGTTVSSFTTLEFNNVTYTANEKITLNGTGVGGAGAINTVFIPNTRNDSSFAGQVLLNADSSIGADAGAALLLKGKIIEGNQGSKLTKVGAGDVKLEAAANAFSGGATVSAGTLSIGADGALGAAGKNVIVANGATLRFYAPAGQDGVTQSKSYTYQISGNGVGQMGAITNSGGNNVIGGATSVITLQDDSRIGVAPRSKLIILADVNKNGKKLNTTPATDAGLKLAGKVTAQADVIMDGEGTTEIASDSDYDGPTFVNLGTLLVNGSLSANPNAVTVSSSATLGGAGMISRPTSILDGGALAPGNAGPGTLTVGDLTLSQNALLNYDLGAASSSNDLVQVNGNLVLAGVLNINTLPGFGSGTYTLLTYSGSMLNGGLVFGATPAGFNYSIDLSTAHQVNLIVASSGPRMNPILTFTNGQAQLQATGQPGQTYRLEASTDLRAWVSVGSATADADGLIQISDPQASQFAHRFYRVAFP